MSRLRELRRNELDDAGRNVWDLIAGSRGPEVVTEAGYLVGPFNAWVHAPAAGARVAELGAVLRFGTSLERRLVELAIITVGAHWRAEFEWWAHVGMAREHGISDLIIEAVGSGQPPPFQAEDERVVHSLARQLLDGGRIDVNTYEAALRIVGEPGMVELVALCGYYTLVSFTLNAFEVQLPAGVTTRWDR